LPGGRVASTWHVGSYHELPRTYARLEAWIDEQGYTRRGAAWEIYWTDPGIEPDPAKWRTQVLWPIGEWVRSSRTEGYPPVRASQLRAAQVARAARERELIPGAA
jgi:DNA gyrase inhibitor GyrI